MLVATIVLAFVLGFAAGRRKPGRRVVWTESPRPSASFAHPVALSSSASTELVELVRGGKKIEAIRRYRELFGASLRDAKDAIDALERAPARRP